MLAGPTVVILGAGSSVEFGMPIGKELAADIQPLREVRRARQAPAHTFTKDSFSADYHTKRKQILWDIFNALSNLRRTFAKHPRARQIEIPDWLDSGQIDVF